MTISTIQLAVVIVDFGGQIGLMKETTDGIGPDAVILRETLPATDRACPLHSHIH